MRISRCLRNLSPLQAALTGVQGVWGMDFHNNPTTRTISFNDGEAVPQPDGTTKRVRAPSTPMYHVMELDGSVAKGVEIPNIPRDVCEKIMHTMVKQNMTDQILLRAQRQGRISFYMTAFGEEAAVAGSAAALKFEDEIFLQYRESGVLTYRGFTIPQMISQCMGNQEDPFKGRQMPIHYGSKELNVQMVSSPLGTQIPHAAGAGYAFKLEGTKERICVCYFGEGAASEGDFHAGVNFASTVGSHTLFFVRNNGFAISTPTSDQYHGDGILLRGVAYGLPSVRVDGNDVLAVYEATQKSRALILERSTPVLLEAMSYRVSHHSTSDDSTAYRSAEEISHFDETFSPIRRFGNFLEKQGWWSEARTKEIQDAARDECLSELKRQEKLPPVVAREFVLDTYATMTPNLVRQKKETMEHVARNAAHYNKAH